MGNPAGYVPETIISDGVTTRLPFSYQAFDTSTIKIKVIDQTTGLYTDKTVTSVETTYGIAGGYANIAVPATAGDTYVIYDDAPYSQDLNIQATGDLRNDLWVKGLDKISRQIQIVADAVRRSLKFAIGETTVDGTFTGAVAAGRALVINDTADGIKVSDTSIDDIDAALATAEAQALAAAGSATTASGYVTAASGYADTASGYASDANDAKIAAEAAAGTFTLASQAEAEAGTDNVKYMSSLRVKQSITANTPAQKTFQAKSSVTIGTIYQAASDGFVYGYIEAPGGSSGYLAGYTDSNATPTTLVAGESVDAATITFGSLLFPVRKDDYFKIEKVSGAGTVNATAFFTGTA